MPKPDLTEALDNVEMTYSDVVNISNDMLSPLFTPINKLVQEVDSKINALTAEEIRGFMMRLQLRAYEISEIKDKSTLKASLAETLRKEKYAMMFNEAQGTAGTKDNTALLAASEEIVVEALYNLVANLLRTKLDQLHRLIATLSSILISRMQEAKMSMNGLE
jgi:hypothetical protein